MRLAVAMEVAVAMHGQSIDVYVVAWLRTCGYSLGILARQAQARMLQCTREICVAVKTLAMKALDCLREGTWQGWLHERARAMLDQRAAEPTMILAAIEVLMPQALNLHGSNLGGGVRLQLATAAWLALLSELVGPLPCMIVAATGQRL